MPDTIVESRTETPKRFQCRHIFTDGHRCGSACLHHEEFCYYHHTARRPVANPKTRRSRRSTFHLPLPEDRSAIQASIGEVLQRIASNDIDPRRAGLLLYGLQIASLNLPKPEREAAPAPETVEEITTDPELGILAPRTDISETARPKSAVALLLERMMQMQPEEEAEPAPSPKPATIPTLQATADNRHNTYTGNRGPLSFRPERSAAAPIVISTGPRASEASRGGSGEIRFSTSSLNRPHPAHAQR
jgi:hypothetical protein